MHKSTIKTIIRHTCNQCGCPELSDPGRIIIEFTDKLTSSLADACYDYESNYGIIRLANSSWNKLQPLHKVELLIHEICHIVADYTHGDYIPYTPHGKQWRILMMCAGIHNPYACLDVDC